MENQLDLNKLRIFKEVVQEGSFTKAANNLKQPKSRISRTISGLEKELGAQLIIRTTRQLQLTQVGQDLYSRLGPILNDLQGTIESVMNDSTEVSGLIRITVPEDIGMELFGKFCREFTQLYPKVQIALHASNTVVDLVKNQIDIALRINLGKAKDSTMIQKQVGIVDMAFVMTPENFKKYGLIKVDDLEKIPSISYDAFDGKALSTKLTRRNETKTIKLKSTFTANNFFIIRSMALDGAGVAHIPSFLVRDHIMKGELVQVFKDWKHVENSLQILIPPQKKMHIKVRKFVDFITPKLMQYF